MQNILKKIKNKVFLKKVYLPYVTIEKTINVPVVDSDATEMLHNNKKKTIYYKNAVVKIYDIPVFYIPRLSHPDPYF